jgi:hypothetical protein
MIAANASAIMNTSVPSAAEMVAASIAQTTSAPHIANPNHEALSISAATMASSVSPSAMPRWGRK